MKTSKKKIWRNDVLLIISILILSSIFAFVLYFTSTDGNHIDVSVDGKVLMSFELGIDREELIETENGTNLLVIKNGKASVKSADCPDEICVKHREISKTGETIVCLPHKLVVEIVKE